MKTLYFDCASGISGDMALAALLDLGVPEDYLRAQLESLHVGGWALRTGRIKKCGISAMDADVVLESDHGHEHGHNHGHGHAHAHAHRGLADILEIIRGGGMASGAAAKAVRMFTLLAEAEARVHGSAVDEVHFHEVGAVDSIIDLCGAAICLDYLSPDRIICSPLSEGHGHVRCQHGLMPVPVPATAEIVRAFGIPLRLTDTEGEMVTPTGAAILAACCGGFGEKPPVARLAAVGTGAGKKDFPHANVLRAMLFESSGDETDTVTVIETNIDDSTPEILGYAMERLFEAGALDVFYTPVYMKKNRPAAMLTVLCAAEKADSMADIIFRETGSIGLRLRETQRKILPRETRLIDTPYGPVNAKLAGGRLRVEYEEAKKLAISNNVSLQKIYGVISSHFG